MIKKTQGIKASVVLDETFISDYRNAVPSPYTIIENEEKSLVRQNVSLISDISSYREYITTKEKSVACNLLAIADFAKEKESVDTSVYERRLEREQRALSKIAKLESFKISPARCSFTTKPLFVNIRVGDGERKTQRRCIGSFSVTVNWGESDIYAENVTFEGLTRSHWSIYENHRICLGEWESMLAVQRSDRDLAELVTTMIAYLTSTDDAAAFLPSHHWLSHRNDCINERQGNCPPLFVGDCVVLTESNGQNLGVRGIVVEVHNNGTHYRLSATKGVTGDSVLSYTGWINISSLAKITKLDYKRLIMLQSIEYVKQKTKRTGAKTKERVMKDLDDAPEGITNEDLKKIM